MVRSPAMPPRAKAGGGGPRGALAAYEAKRSDAALEDSVKLVQGGQHRSTACLALIKVVASDAALLPAIPFLHRLLHFFSTGCMLSDQALHDACTHLQACILHAEQACDKGTSKGDAAAAAALALGSEAAAVGALRYHSAQCLKVAAYLLKVQAGLVDSSAERREVYRILLGDRRSSFGTESPPALRLLASDDDLQQSAGDSISLLGVNIGEEEALWWSVLPLAQWVQPQQEVTTTKK